MKRDQTPRLPLIPALREVACRREDGAHLLQGGSHHQIPVILIPLLHGVPQEKLRQLQCFSVVSPQQLLSLVLGSAGVIPQPLRAVLRLAPL